MTSMNDKSKDFRWGTAVLLTYISIMILRFKFNFFSLIAAHQNLIVLAKREPAVTVGYLMNVTKTLTLTGPVPEVQRMLMWQQHLFYRGRAVTILATTIILFTTFSTATPVEEQESAVAVEGSLLLSLFITILLLQSLAPQWMLASFLIPVKILQLHNHRGRLYFFLFPLLSCSIITSEKRERKKSNKIFSLSQWLKYFKTRNKLP